MRVVESILHRIKDNEPLVDQIAVHESVAELVKAYNKLSMAHNLEGRESMYIVTGETFGSDLKRYIHHLPENEQIKLLDRYLLHFVDVAGAEVPPPLPITTAEQEAVRDERRLKHWVFKIAVLAGLFFFFLLMGAIVAILAHEKTTDNALIKTLMETAGEVIKLLFSNAK